MYQAHYVNPVFQSDLIEYELILEDSEGILAPYRISKVFKSTATAVDLATEAEKTINAVLAAQEQPVSESAAAILIDVPSDEVLPE